MERLVFVHGSVVGGAATWRAQAPLRERFELVVLERPGFPPSPPVERVDFEADAAWLAELLQPGDHLVGHSYGGVVCLLAAAAQPEALASLAVVEPPCTSVALDVPAVREFAEGGARLWAEGPRDDPEAFLRLFLEAVGSGYEPPTPLPPELDQTARMLMSERGPWEAEVPLAALAATEFPKLVVSGAHHAAFDAICDRLEQALSAEHSVFRGHGHAAQRHPDFNATLANFVERTARRKPG